MNNKPQKKKKRLMKKIETAICTQQEKKKHCYGERLKENEGKRESVRHVFYLKGK